MEKTNNGLMENVSKGKNNFYFYYQNKLNMFTILTKEEKDMFKKIFNNLDKNKCGYINIQTAHDFMERSELSEEILNKIKDICKIQNDRFYPNEFYMALRLISLAQNSLPFTEQEIINNNFKPPLPKFKEPNKYPPFNPQNFVDIYTIYKLLNKFEENMNNKFEKLNKRIEEINKKNEEDNKKIISLLNKIYEKEKKDINLSNNKIDHNGENFSKSNNPNSKITLPIQKNKIKQNRRSPEPIINRNCNFKKLPKNNMNEEKEKKLNDNKVQYFTKKIGENKNLNLTQEKILTLNNNIKLLNPETINNNLMDKGSTNKNITPFDGEKKEINLNS